MKGGTKTDFDMVGMFKSDADIQQGDWIEATDFDYDVYQVISQKLHGDTQYKLAQLRRRHDT